jgi:hypothetical protein
MAPKAVDARKRFGRNERFRALQESGSFPTGHIHLRPHPLNALAQHFPAA